MRLGFPPIKNPDIRCSWGVILLKILKQGTTGVFNCSKSKKKLQLAFSFIVNAEIRYWWGFVLLKMLKQGTVAA